MPNYIIGIAFDCHVTFYFWQVSVGDDIESSLNNLTSMASVLFTPNNIDTDPAKCELLCCSVQLLSLYHQGKGRPQVSWGLRLYS